MLLFAHLGLALLAARPFRRADLTFVAIGSMLPDIIDKPLGVMLYGSFSMGRILAHTLLFLLLLATLALYLRDIRIVSLFFGVLIHLMLDYMWNSPVTFLWPLLGPFPSATHIDTINYIEMLLSGLRDPGIFIPELMGIAYIIYLAAETNPQLIIKIKSIWTH